MLEQALLPAGRLKAVFGITRDVCKERSHKSQDGGRNPKPHPFFMCAAMHVKKSEALFTDFWLPSSLLGLPFLAEISENNLPFCLHLNLSEPSPPHFLPLKERDR